VVRRECCCGRRVEVDRIIVVVLGVLAIVWVNWYFLVKGRR
jgi:hypothetical protein